MKRRRFSHCIMQVQAAIASGALDSARNALSEARQLIPDALEVAVLDRRILEVRDGSASPLLEPLLAFEGEDDDSSEPAGPVSTGIAPDPDAPSSSERDRGTFLAGLPLVVVPLAIVGVLGLGLEQISQFQPRLPGRTAQPRKPPQIPSGDSQGAVASGGPARNAAADVGSSAQATPLMIGSLGIYQPTHAAPTSHDIQPVSSPTSAPQPAVLAPNPASPESAVMASSFDLEAAGDDEQIRAALKRYEEAYNRINRKAATAVWSGAEGGPGEGRLDALLSGRIALGVCDITKSGEVGVATCAGLAASDPRVGGGGRADRHWAFDLRKVTGGWRIEQLKVE